MLRGLTQLLFGERDSLAVADAGAVPTWDLDLDAITPRVLASGGVWRQPTAVRAHRNQASHLAAYLERHHPGHYMLFDVNPFAAVRYSYESFGSQVVEIDCGGRVVGLETLLEFCTCVSGWLAMHADNVAVVHCQSGRTTALAILAFLIYSKAASDSAEAIQLYRSARRDCETLTQAGMRCLCCFSDMLAFHGAVPNPYPLSLDRLIVHTQPSAANFDPADWQPVLHVFRQNVLVFSSETPGSPDVQFHGGYAAFEGIRTVLHGASEIRLLLKSFKTDSLLHLCSFGPLHVLALDFILDIVQDGDEDYPATAPLSTAPSLADALGALSTAHAVIPSPAGLEALRASGFAEQDALFALQRKNNDLHEAHQLCASLKSVAPPTFAASDRPDEREDFLALVALPAPTQALEDSQRQRKLAQGKSRLAKFRAKQRSLPEFATSLRRVRVAQDEHTRTVTSPASTAALGVGTAACDEPNFALDSDSDSIDCGNGLCNEVGYCVCMPPTPLLLTTNGEAPVPANRDWAGDVRSSSLPISTVSSKPSANQIPPAAPVASASDLAPPPPMLGSKGEVCIVDDPTRRVVVKKIHWNAVPQYKLQNTIWSSPAKDAADIDVQEFEDLFCRLPSPVKPDGYKSLPRKQPQQASFLTTRRANNINISLTRFAKVFHGLDELKQAVFEMDDQNLSLDDLLMLKRILPSEDEAKVARVWATDQCPSKAEKFCKFMVSTETGVDCTQVVDCFMYMLGFSESQGYLASAAADMVEACREVRVSPSLRALLRMVVDVGNLANHDFAAASSRSARVQGIKVESLDKLQSVRSAKDAKLSLLQFVVNSVALKSPHLLGVAAEVSHLERARHVDLLALQSECDQLTRGLAHVTAILKRGTALPAVSRQRVHDFVNRAEECLQQTQASIAQAQVSATELLQYFAEDANMAITDLLSRLNDFCTHFRPPAEATTCIKLNTSK